MDSSDDGRAYLEPGNGGRYQIWRWDGKYFTDLQTGLLLDSNNNGDVYTNSNNGGIYQKWINRIESGNTKIINWGTDRYLDGDASGNMLTSASDKVKYPVWNLIEGLFCL